MEIKDLIKCDNDEIIPKESKMIANLLLSGNKYSTFSYKQVSDDIQRHYGVYIRFNAYDRYAKQYNNVARLDVGKYAGQVSKVCHELGFPMLSVMIDNGSLPEEGFFKLCDDLGFEVGKSNRDRYLIIKQLIYERFDEIKQGLVEYLNGVKDKKSIVKIIARLTFDNKVTDVKQHTTIESVELKEDLYEGNTKERFILQKERNQEVVKRVKERDKYKCRVCGFYYKDKIVEVHHLIPLSESQEDCKIELDNLVTLCPNCHSMAHLLLNEDTKYRDKDILLKTLKSIKENLTKII